MTSVLNKESKLVLKLDLGEDGVRRIPLSKLWDEDRSVVSYDRLIELAISFKNLKLRGIQNGRLSITTTYIDIDGDEITISSDDELIDAFTQFVDSKPPVLRAKTTIVRRKNATSSATEDFGKKKLRSIPDVSHGQNEINNQPSPAVLATAIPVAKTIQDKNAQAENEISGYDPNFIHGRHTCDGCLSTPIYGIRYHAENLQDYDLCSTCYGNYKGSDVIFKPVQLDRDRDHQTRWKNRQQRRLNLHGSPPCQAFSAMNNHGQGALSSSTQIKNNAKCVDADLTEAIRRSLIDAWPSKSKDNKKEDSSSTDVKTTTVKTESKTETPASEDCNTIATPTVEVSAGNEYTQQVLKTMDPNMKETLRLSLEECFARRKQRNTSCNDKVANLSPDKNTQRKIDLMDEETKKAISRSLNEFLATRLCKEDNVKNTTGVTESKEQIRQSLDDFFANRLMLKTRREKSIDDNESEINTVPSVVVDIIVDSDNVSNQTQQIDSVSNVSESVNKFDDDSEKSEGNDHQDDWQVVTEDEKMIATAAQMLGSALFQSDSA
jgi:hypothetical protein